MESAQCQPPESKASQVSKFRLFIGRLYDVGLTWNTYQHFRSSAQKAPCSHCDPFLYSLNLEISLHLLWQSFEWTLTRPTNINCDKILFLYSEMIQVFLFFFFMLCYVIYFVIINFYKKYLLLLLFFFIKNTFIFLMFWDVPGCSVFRVLSTPTIIINMWSFSVLALHWW